MKDYRPRAVTRLLHLACEEVKPPGRVGVELVGVAGAARCPHSMSLVQATGPKAPQMGADD